MIQNHHGCWGSVGEETLAPAVRVIQKIGELVLKQQIITITITIIIIM
jgi:hypothetical protein